MGPARAALEVRVGIIVLLCIVAVTMDAAGVTPIHDIQGRGSSSQYVGSTVTTRGVVTAVRYNGFFVQAPDGEADGDPATSEGVFVYTGGAPPGTATVGTLVEVRGRVAEYIPSADPGSPPLTEISGSPTVGVLGAGQSLPEPVMLAAGDADPGGDVEQLERFEGMRVGVASLTVVGPTQGSVDEKNATGSSNGVFYGVTSGLSRPFREPGVAAPDPLPLPGSPRFDANPERLRVDSDALVGAGKLEVAAGMVVTGLVGPLDYAYRTYTILPEPDAQIAVEGTVSARAVAAPAANEVTVATWNLQRFFDATDDPGVGEGAILTASAFDHRLAKASLAVRQVLRCPDVLAVQEVENLASLEALATRIDADALVAGLPEPGYRAYLEEGNDPSGIDVGFLVRFGRIVVEDAEQAGKVEVFQVDGTLLNDRPPLLLEVMAHPSAGGPFPLTLVVNHLRSLIGVDDPSSGPRVRAKREAQAEYLARLVQSRQQAAGDERILVLGDFNAFEVNDGYVDVLGTVAGDPTPASEVLVASPDLVEPDLVNLRSRVAAGQAYEYVQEGNAQSLAHILASAGLLPLVTRVEVAHLAADFPESLRADPERPERLSDHDAIVAYMVGPDTLPARPPRRLVGR